MHPVPPTWWVAALHVRLMVDARAALAGGRGGVGGAIVSWARGVFAELVPESPPPPQAATTKASTVTNSKDLARDIRICRSLLFELLDEVRRYRDPVRVGGYVKLMGPGGRETRDDFLLPGL